MKNHSWRKRLLIGFPLTLTLLIAVLLLLREVFFTGAVVPPAPVTRGKIIDMHAHIAGIGAVDTQGKLDLPRTEIYIPNEYVAALVKRYPDLFYFGASINPYRKDALT